MRTATITIDPAAITHNVAQVKKHAPQSQVLAMVKANAYGHGIDAVLPAITQADAIGVATLEEAIESRRLGWEKPICLIEGVFSATEWQQAIYCDCSCVIHHAPQLDWALATIPDDDSPSREVWLKFNTGMNRLGFDENMIIDAARRLNDAGYQIILTSHFANADDSHHPLNVIQIERFSTILALLRKTVCQNIKASLCNSAAVVNYPAHHYDWVRPGIMLYGSSPVNDKSAHHLELQPAMTFSTQVMALQTVKAGDAIGYGSRWIAKQDTRTALVSIGYGDGYPRVIDDDAYVCVLLTHDNVEHCYPCPIRGRVAMDMIVIDIDDVPTEVALDSTVVLWGDAPHIDEVAAHAGTISYELLCRLSARPKRVVG